MALREINLVPEDILARRLVKRHLLFWAGCLCVSLSLLGALYLYQNRVADARRPPSNALEQAEKTLDSRLEEIGEIRKELERLSQQEALLRSITRNRPFSGILLNLSRIMNASCWLTELAIEERREEEKHLNLVLTGFSSSNEQVGDFLNRLTEEPMFENVLLKYARETHGPRSSEKRTEEGTLIQFRIECNLREVGG